MEQFNEKLLEVMLGNGLVSELAYRFPLLLSWLTWVAASIVCLLVALVACLKWFLLSEWEIKETFSTMVFQGCLYYLITPTSNNQVLKDYVIILWGFFLGSLHQNRWYQTPFFLLRTLLLNEGILCLKNPLLLPLIFGDINHF